MTPLRKIAVIGNSLPRRCGIATFSTDLQRSVSNSEPNLQTCIVAMTDHDQTYDYPASVALQIKDDSIDEYVDALLRHAPSGVTVLCEPGRSLVGNAGVTLYTVGTVKRRPGVRTYVAVDGGMSDNLRPMLYGARYEAEIADRFGGGDACTIAGMHCESGDILVRDAVLDDPRPGDVLVIPATGAYGHAMANNYNALLRPPVIFCRDGDARVVVRRETLDDLTARDV